MMPEPCLRLACALLLGALGAAAFALTAPQALAIAAGDSDQRIAALNAAVARGDDAPRRVRPGAARRRGQGRRRQGLHRPRRQGDRRRHRRRRRRCPKAPRTSPTTTASAARSRRRSPACACSRPTSRCARARRRRARQGVARRVAAAADREGVRRRSRPGLKSQLERMRATILVSSSDRTQAPRRRRRARRQQPGRGRQPAAGAARRGRRDRRRSARGPAAGARLGPRSARLGRTPRGRLHRHQPRLGAPPGRSRPGHHLRPDGRHQHGARRADDDRRLHDLRRAEPLPRLSAGPVRRYVLAAIPAAFLVSAAGRRGARARRDPLPLRPAARDAARDLGHQPGAAAGGALALRRAERAGRKPELALGRRRGDEQPRAALQPDRDHRLRLHRPRRRRPADRARRASACSSAA